MELSYISGNQNPKKLLIFHEIMLWARKIIIKKKKHAEKNYISGNETFKDTFGSLKKYIFKIALSQMIPEITPSEIQLQNTFLKKLLPQKMHVRNLF